MSSGHLARDPSASIPPFCLELDCGPWGRRVRASARSRCASLCVCVSLSLLVCLPLSSSRYHMLWNVRLHRRSSACAANNIPYLQLVHCTLYHPLITSSTVLSSPQYRLAPSSIRISSSLPPAIPLQSVRLPSPTAKSPVGPGLKAHCQLCVKQRPCRPCSRLPADLQAGALRRRLNTRPSRSQSPQSLVLSC